MHCNGDTTDNYTTYNASSIAMKPFIDSDTYKDIWITFDMIMIILKQYSMMMELYYIWFCYTFTI